MSLSKILLSKPRPYVKAKDLGGSSPEIRCKKILNRYNQRSQLQ